MLHLKERRKEAGLLQQELANQAGISVEYVRLLEKGLRNPTVYVAQRVAGVLKCDVRDIWPLEGEGVLKSKQNRVRDKGGECYSCGRWFAPLALTRKEGVTMCKQCALNWGKKK